MSVSLNLLYDVIAYGFVGLMFLLLILSWYYVLCKIPRESPSSRSRQSPPHEFAWSKFKAALRRWQPLMIVWGKRLLGVVGLAVVLAVLKSANPSIIGGILWYVVPGGIFFAYLWQRSLGLRPKSSVWIPVLLLTVALSAVTTMFVQLRLPHPLENTTADAMGVMVLSALPSALAVALLEWAHPTVLPEDVRLSQPMSWVFASLFAVVAAILPILWLVEHAWGLAVIMGFMMVACTVYLMRKSPPGLRYLLMVYGAQWLAWNLAPIIWHVVVKK